MKQKQNTYTSAFKEQALVKLYSRGDKSIRSVASEINLNFYTAKGWMRDAKKLTKTQGLSTNAPEKRPQDWTRQEQLFALQATYGLPEAELHAWCRSHGLFAHHLTTWQAEFCASPVTSASNISQARELKGLQADIDKLKREMVRKDKALAEAAALLILQKKFSALWADEEK
jgi:transposase-like protein